MTTGRKRKADMDDRIAALYDRGLSDSAIGRALDIPTQRASRWRQLTGKPVIGRPGRPAKEPVGVPHVFDLEDTGEL